MNRVMLDPLVGWCPAQKGIPMTTTTGHLSRLLATLVGAVIAFAAILITTRRRLEA